MTDTEQPQQTETQEPEHSNIKLIYEHVEYQIALVNRSIDISVTKLGFVLGLATGLIIYQAAVDSISNRFLFFDAPSVILSLAILGFCLAGFQSKGGELLTILNSC